MKSILQLYIGSAYHLPTTRDFKMLYGVYQNWDKLERQIYDQRIPSTQEENLSGCKWLYVFGYKNCCTK